MNAGITTLDGATEIGKRLLDERPDLAPLKVWYWDVYGRSNCVEVGADDGCT